MQQQNVVLSSNPTSLQLECPFVSKGTVFSRSQRANAYVAPSGD